jgi:hypothetical protein
MSRHTSSWATHRREVSGSGIFLLGDYSEDQEQEADWYAGTMLLPRDALWHHRSRAKSAEEIGKLYGINRALCEWRLRMTGVEIQLERRRV